MTIIFNGFCGQTAYFVVQKNHHEQVYVIPLLKKMLFKMHLGPTILFF